MSQFSSVNDHFVLVPAIMLALFGCAILLLDTWLFPDLKDRKYTFLLVVVALCITGFGLWRQQVYVSAGPALTAFDGSLTMDGFALFFNWIFWWPRSSLPWCLTSTSILKASSTASITR